MKKPGVKDRIVETASRLFYFNGYNQTGINQIIEEAGVAKASMYQHFRSKEDVAVAYLQRRHTAWTAALQQHIEDKEGLDAKVEGFFDYVENWLKEVDFRGCGWQNIITDLPQDQQKIKDQAVFHKGELRSWLSQLLEEQYETKEAQELADEVFMLVEGAIISAQIHEAEWPIRSARRAARKLLKI